MDRMRDVPSEEYATLHDVYKMLTSQKGSYGMNFDLFYSNKLILVENKEKHVRKNVFCDFTLRNI